MDTPHIVPLSQQSIAVLRALSLLTGDGRLVFPGANDKQKPMSNNTILFALYRLGYKGRMTGHGFRGLASTILHENGFEDEHVELQLAHQMRNRVAAAYNHAKYLNQRKAMMQWWADYLDAQLAKGRQKIIGIRADRLTVGAFNLFNSILAGMAVFIGGFAFGHWATNSDPAFLRILAKSERYKTRYDAAKQQVPRVEVR
jgi:Phage integrase family